MVLESMKSCFRHPYNMVGFRPSLSTQDVMLLLKTQVIDNRSRDVRGILALGLSKAFETVAHDFILKEISALNLGGRFFTFVESSSGAGQRLSE